VLVTAGLGVFWVARMDLPAFDWHYLFGYCVVLLVVVHLGFQLRVLGAFFRRVSPDALLAPDGGFRKSVRRTFGALAALVLGLPVAWLMIEAFRATPPRIVRQELAAHEADGASASQVVLSDGTRKDVIDYLYDESSYSRTAVLGRPKVAVDRPPDVKRYTDAPVVALPAPSPLAGIHFDDALGPREESRSSSEPLRLEQVGELLHYAVGVTNRKASAAGILLRASASSGALYPTDVYVVSREVEGLARGIHYYDPHTHSLSQIGGADALESVKASLPEPRLFESVPVFFVLGVTFDRTVWKYAVRSYRYVALDTGHAAANLLLAARARECGCVLEPAFDDERLGRALGLPLESEGALLALFCKRGMRTRASTSNPSTEPLPLPASAEEAELTRLSHRLTSWRLIGGLTLGAPEKPRVFAPAERRGVDLDLFTVIANRRSFREFAPGSVELKELTGLLEDAAERSPRLRDRLVDPYVLVRSVEGLEPGAYRYRGNGKLEALARGRFSGQIASAGLSQELLERAAFVLAWGLGEGIGQVEGARDFRSACIDAGMAGEIAYLSATRQGLGICGVGAFYDAEVNQLFLAEGRAPRIVYLQGVGQR
jgi:SagB-type dehydrogenase family enzyme